MTSKWLCAISLVVAVGCRSTAGTDFETLADSPAAPYSIRVTGGAFVAPGSVESPLDATFREPGVDDSFEAIPLQEVTRALRLARTFVSVDGDQRDARTRQRLAATGPTLPLADADASQLLLEASRDGYDYLLFVESVEDGPISEFGINSRWPITAIAWLAVGIGMVIPDHTFESTARLRVTLRDVHSGEVVYRRVLDGEPVDLALIDRADFWGILQSILVPPFWVANDEVRVARQMRQETARRMLFLLAQDLKSASCIDELRSAAPMQIDLAVGDDGLQLTCVGPEGANFVRLSVDGVEYAPAGWRAALLASATVSQSTVSYEVSVPKPTHGRYLQVLVQTIGGRVSSSTFDLNRLPRAR